MSLAALRCRRRGVESLRSRSYLGGLQVGVPPALLAVVRARAGTVLVAASLSKVLPHPQPSANNRPKRASLYIITQPSQDIVMTVIQVPTSSLNQLSGHSSGDTGGRQGWQV